ncbi:hypothetical protein [Filomicrobium sp.]|uniref:hypothetical protein n=1 Tax=Filomicrobium sp. TaxID=2024831 RepID=UPI0025836199|nr:hypothetical protein [Filomicrobium sp.]MCV0371709.1 phosphate acetyltransferase [Filomicrobium sp.]
MIDQIPDGPKGKKCHRNGKDCARVCRTCVLWVHLDLVDPQTGEPVRRWDCSDKWANLLRLKGLQETERAAIEVNKLRNEVAAMKRELGQAVAGVGNTVMRRVEDLSTQVDAVQAIAGPSAKLIEQVP